MKIKLGVAPDSWGIWFPSDPKQMPWQRCFDEMAQVGFKWVELGPYGYLPTDPAVVRAELAARHLIPVAQAIDEFALENADNWHKIETTISASGELLAAVGAEQFILIDAPYSALSGGQTVAPATLDDQGWHQLIDTTHRVADMLRERYGIKLLFHPHAESHVEYEAQIERFLADTDPARVNLCFDTGHHAYRGGDPVAFMRKHHKRIPFLHLKSIDAEIQRKVAAEGIPFAKAVGMNMFCEPSRGAVDFKAFRDVLHEIDYDGFAIVEQDMYPAPLDRPLPIAKRTREYLLSLGIGA